MAPMEPHELDQALRDHVTELLTSRGAHVDFDAAVEDLPEELYGARPEGQPHSPWQLLEHLRIAQWDILGFSRHPAHVSPQWPDGYWPAADAPESAAAWAASVESFRSDLAAMVELVQDPALDLLDEIPWGEGQTLLREALLLADHNAYHVGQLVTVRRLLGAWPAGR